jgi:hypothetical protein
VGRVFPPLECCYSKLLSLLDRPWRSRAMQKLHCSARPSLAVMHANLGKSKYLNILAIAVSARLLQCSRKPPRQASWVGEGSHARFF